jgi:hypothetical protein
VCSVRPRAGRWTIEKPSRPGSMTSRRTAAGCSEAAASSSHARAASPSAYGANEEEAEAGALDLDLVVARGAVEAFEDAFELAGGRPRPVSVMVRAQV